MFPSSQAIAVDQLQMGWSVAKKQRLDKILIGTRILPLMPTQDGKQSGTYRTWDDTTFMLSTGSIRPPGKQLARAMGAAYDRMKQLKASSSTFRCAEYGQEMQLDLLELARADAPLQLEKNANDICARMVLMAQEQRIVNLVFSTANVTNNQTNTGGQQWNDYTNSSPIDDIQGMVTTITGTAGLTPEDDDYEFSFNSSDQTWNRLKFHPQLAAVMAVNRDRFLEPEDMMKYFGFSQINVTPGLANSANDGQSASFTRFVGKDVLLAYTQKSPTFETTTFGISAQEFPLLALQYPEQWTNSTVKRNTHSTAEVILTATAAGLIKAAVAS